MRAGHDRLSVAMAPSTTPSARGEQSALRGDAAGAVVPLVVDLDGTFLQDDSLKRMLRIMALRRPHRVPLAFVQKRRAGKPAFKIYALRHSRLTEDDLPRRTALAEWLDSEAKEGRQIHLATGSPEELARAVASAHPFFVGVFATRPGTNMTGAVKAQHLCDAFGQKGFDYAGNSWADLEVWKHARRAILCGVDRRLREAAAAVCEIEREFP